MMAGTGRTGFWAAGVVVGVLMQAASAPEARGQGGRQERLELFAEQDMRDVQIELRVVEVNGGRTLRSHPSALDEARIGDRVQVCFQVSEPGYVSLWSQDAGEPPSQIYPNRFTEQSGRVDDSEQCLGRAGSGWGLRVDGPAGESLLFMHYTPDQSDQISESDFPVIRRLRARIAGSYASRTVGFRIVP